MTWKGSISLNVAAQLVNTVISLIVAILVARLLGAEGRGDYVLVITTAMFLVQLFSLGLETSIGYYTSTSKTAIRKLVSTAVFVFLILAGLVALTILIFSFFPSLKLLPYYTRPYYLILFLITFFTLANSFFASLLNGLKRFNAVILLNLSIQVLTLVACLYFFLSGNGLVRATSFLQAVVAIHALISIGYLYFYTKWIAFMPVGSVMNKKELKAFFSYSFLAFLCSLLHFLNLRMDFWFINYYYGSGDLGVYSVAASLSQLIWILPQSIAIILFSMSGYLKEAELKLETNKLCRMALCMTLAILPLVCTGALLIPFLFGNEFAGAVPLLYIFMAGMIPNIFVTILASVFAGTGKLRYNLVASLAGFGLAFLLYRLLIPAYGLTGGAIASSISYIVTGFLGVYFYLKLYKTSWKEILIIKPGEIRDLFLALRKRKMQAI
jgi:O-antigen/teichoic acid export membrane protein